MQEIVVLARGSLIYAEVRARLNRPLAEVWPWIGGFGGLDRWADGVSRCSVEGAGVGAIRTLVRHGLMAREQLVAIDPGQAMIRYRILPPHRLPAEDVHGTILLEALDGSATGVVWRSDATGFGVPPDALGAEIEEFYRASIGGLNRLLGGPVSAAISAG